MSDRPAVAFPPPPPARDRALLLHVLAATLLAVGLRAFHLGAQSLWIDELFTWITADIGRPLAVGALFENIHGPLYGLIVHVCGEVFGDAEWALRLPSLVCGVAVVPALAWLAARWLGRDAAVWAGWLAAGSPFLVWYSQEARGYMQLILCACLGGAFLLGPARRGPAPWTRAAAYLAAAGAGLLTSFSFALLAPLHLRWWLAGDGTTGAADAPSAPPGGARRRLGVAALVALALLLLLSPWAGRVWRTWDWQRLHPAHRATAEEAPLRPGSTFHGAAIPFALHAQAVGYTLGPSLRELRGGLHLDAILAAGLTPHEALTLKSPDQVQLFGIADLHLPDRTADGRQGALCNLHGVRVGVHQIQPVEELAARVLALENVQFEVQVLAATVLGHAHLARDDLDQVLAGRQDLVGAEGLDSGGIESLAE